MADDAGISSGSTVNGQIILAVGLPGSGKSTYFARRRIHALSTDTLRLWLLDDESDQSAQKWVFQVLHRLLEIRLILRRPKNYIDATNLTRADRRVFFRLAERYGYEVLAIYFDVPLDVCRKRNRRRKRTVPEDAMERMAAKLSPPSAEEGFSEITVVRASRKLRR